MANVLVQESSLQDIASAIRSKNGTQNTYKPSQMAGAITDLPSGGITPTGTININANGTHDVTNYASANVSVPNSYTLSDVGKVVNRDRQLVEQMNAQYTANGTYNTTLVGEVEVNVPSGGGTGTKQISITQNGTTTEDVSAYASAEINVNVQGSSVPKLIKQIDFTPAQTYTNSNQGVFNLEPSSDTLIVITIDTTQTAPDASEYIAMLWERLFTSMGDASINTAILRPAGTIGSDASMCNFTKSTGVLKVGGSYGHFMAGTLYHIYQFSLEG